MKSALFIALKLIRSPSNKTSIASPAIKIGIIAVGLGIMVMILTVSIIRGFKHQITFKLKTLTSDVVVMPYHNEQDITSQPLTISPDTLQIIQKLSSIDKIEPVCLKNGILKIKEENEGIVFKGVTHQYHWTILQPFLISGTWPNYTDTAVSKDIVISKKLADRLHIRLHQKLIIYFIAKTKDEYQREKLDYRSKDFYVKAIIHPQMGELDNQLIFGDARIIQKINNWKDNEYSQLEIYAKKDITSADIIKQLIDWLPYNYKLLSAEELYNNIFNWLALIDVNAVIIIVLMLLVAAVNMVSALIILILEKVTLIGILKALGMNNLSIKNIFLFISLKILIQGLFIGNFLTLLVLILQYHFHIFTLNPDAYYMDYIPVEWNFTDWFLLNIGTTITCLISMFIPTYLISDMAPAQILRWE